jgi:uncharacterized protein (TIGR03437 family)
LAAVCGRLKLDEAAARALALNLHAGLKTGMKKSYYLLLPGLVFLLAATASAQFSELAPTNDGSQLYFVTSLRLVSESSLHLPTSPAIYRIQGGAIERITVPPPMSAGNPHLSQGDPEISADGNVFSYTEYQECEGGSSCITYPTTSDSPLSIGGQPYGAPLAGSAQISRNGRFVWNDLEFGFTFPAQADVRQLRDLQAGTTVTVPIAFANVRQAITSDGRLLGFDPQTRALTLWSTSGASILTTTEQPATAIINDAGTWVVYETVMTLAEIHLRALELSTGRDILLARSASSFNASISDDGALVAYLAVPGIGQTTQVLTIHPDGTGGAVLTNFAQPVDTAVLAGLAHTVFAVTGSRLVQIDAQSGTVQELIGSTPVCAPGFLALMPGSILPIRGSGLAGSTLSAPTPLPYTLGGVRVLANGSPLPLLSVSPTEVWFQVPFELPIQPSVSVQLANTSQFAGCPATVVDVVPSYPYFFGSVAHQDFSSLVTNASPAQPGEWIHLYAVGLGVVTPALATGIPAPLDRLYPIANPFECHGGYDVSGQPITVGFAGIAPGMIGIYQVDIQMPYAPIGGLSINCGTPGNTTERGGAEIPFGNSSGAG